MRTAVIGLALVLTACAASREQIQDAASRTSNMDLCMHLTTFGRNSDIIYTELARRGENCQQYAAAMQAQAAQRRADAANLAATMQILQAMQPPPAPAMISPSMNCYSRPTGNGSYQTICN